MTLGALAAKSRLQMSRFNLTLFRREVNKRVLPLLKYCGYTYEKMDMLIAPMVKSGAEPLGSMGQEILSDSDRLS